MWDIINEIQRKINSEVEVRKKNDKAYLKFTNNHRILPNSKKHGSNTKKGKFP